jgi:hypothetical protein
MRRITQGTLQYVVIKPITTVVAVVSLFRINDILLICRTLNSTSAIDL